MAWGILEGWTDNSDAFYFRGVRIQRSYIVRRDNRTEELDWLASFDARGVCSIARAQQCLAELPYRS